MNIVILSRNKNLYSTSRLVEACKEADHDVRVLDHLKCDIISEQDNPCIYYEGEKITNVDAVIPRIGASVTFYGSAVVRQFEMMQSFTAVESQALQRSRDKLRSLQILARSGVGMPKTVFTNYSSDAKQIINSLGGPPLIIKTLEGTQGLGVVLAPTRKAAESIIQAFHSINVRVIVQEFIEEARNEDVRAFVVNGEVIGAMKRRGKEDDFRSNLHRGGTAELLQLSQQWRQTALIAAEAMGLSIAGVDLIHSHRGPMVLEVNSSPGLQGIESATQKDIAGAIIEFVEQKVIERSGQKFTVPSNSSTAINYESE